MFLPVVHPDILHSLIASPCDTNSMLDRIERENPQIYHLLMVMQRRGDSITGAVVLYRMLAEQAESDALEELFRYDP